MSELASDTFAAIDKEIRFQARRINLLTTMSITVDDLIQIGWVCAMSRMKLYNPKQGTLISYLRYGLRGAMIDHWRSEYKADYLRTPVERPESGLSYDPHSKKWREHWSVVIRGEEDGRSYRTYREIEARILARQIMLHANLKERHAKILLECEAGELTFKQIGAKYGVNESRVSQIRKFAIGKLREAA